MSRVPPPPTQVHPPPTQPPPAGTPPPPTQPPLGAAPPAGRRRGRCPANRPYRIAIILIALVPILAAIAIVIIFLVPHKSHRKVLRD